MQMAGSYFAFFDGAHVLLSKTWYHYRYEPGTGGESGNVERIVPRAGTSNTYTAIRFGYASNGQTATYLANEQWTWDGVQTCSPAASYVITAAREFRYDSGQARYLNRNLDVSAVTGLMHNPPIFATLTNTWTDYDDDDAYGDYFTCGTAGKYEPGIWNTVGSSNNYSHSDHLGTLRQTSDASGDEGTRRVFTAFGERITGFSTVDRFGYVGEHGYQAHAEFPFLHVGARYYDPASGRFLQRDPIGVNGGINVYAYSNSRPTVEVDPSGTMSSLNNPQAPAVIADLAAMGYVLAPKIADKISNRMPLDRIAPTIQGAIRTGQIFFDSLHGTWRFVYDGATICINRASGHIASGWPSGAIPQLGGRFSQGGGSLTY